MRYFLRLTYKGTHYHGWQSQPDAVSVQETIERSLALLLHPGIEITGAGRTDSGVHALEMFAHFDCDADFNLSQLKHRLNAMLPKDIAVYEVIPVEADSHARFDATSRTYEYHIHQYKDPFLEYASWFYAAPLDVDKMNEAAALLLQQTDFECFSKVNTDVNTFNCTITQANWMQESGNMTFTITADRFLRNMVRAIVGTLLDIGKGKTSIDDFRKILNSRDRSAAGSSVPAHGLYLSKIAYDYLPGSLCQDGSAPEANSRTGEARPFEKNRQVLQRDDHQKAWEKRLPKPAISEKACSINDEKAVLSTKILREALPDTRPLAELAKQNAPKKT